MIRLSLVSVGSLEPGILSILGSAIEEVLDCEVAAEELFLDPAFTFDGQRRQYWSTPLLERLEQMRPPTADRILGVAAVDLFIPILTFVFGEALLQRPPAVISLHRLRPSFYGLPEDRELVLERARREAIHELGHTFGLIHCQDFACVMHVSRVADEIDLKGPGFCPACADQLAASAADS